MILERITLTNFRCFESLELPLDPHLNVFVGGNGSGKSTILQAMAIGLAPFLSALPFEGDRLPIIPSILPSDFRIFEGDRSVEPAMITVHARADDGSRLAWTQARTTAVTIAGKKVAPFSELSDLTSITAYAIHFADKHNVGAPYTLPVFAFYGTNRTVDVPRDRVQDKMTPRLFRRLAGLEDALDSSADLRRSIAWFDVLERQELRELRDREIQDRVPALECVRRAIEAIVEGITNPRIDGVSGRFAVDYASPGGTKVKLHIEQLSDGYQALLGVVMDFALRLALANPLDDTGANPLEAEAILMIDEVDLHLHPAWQQQVVPRLRQTFPNTQIILTTHSPQVLSTVEAKQIRQITRVGGTTTLTPPPSQTRGVASASVMAEVQHVDPVPQVEEAEILNRYRAMIAEGTHDSDEGRAIRGRLDAHFGSTHHLMLDLDRTLRFHEFKRQVAREKV